MSDDAASGRIAKALEDIAMSLDSISDHLYSLEREFAEFRIIFEECTFKPATRTQEDVRIIRTLSVQD